MKPHLYNNTCDFADADSECVLRCVSISQCSFIRTFIPNVVVIHWVHPPKVCISNIVFFLFFLIHDAVALAQNGCGSVGAAQVSRCSAEHGSLLMAGGPVEIQPEKLLLAFKQHRHQLNVLFLFIKSCAECV